MQSADDRPLVIGMLRSDATNVLPYGYRGDPGEKFRYPGALRGAMGSGNPVASDFSAATAQLGSPTPAPWAIGQKGTLGFVSIRYRGRAA